MAMQTDDGWVKTISEPQERTRDTESLGYLPRHVARVKFAEAIQFAVRKLGADTDYGRGLLADLAAEAYGDGYDEAYTESLGPI